MKAIALSLLVVFGLSAHAIELTEAEAQIEQCVHTQFSQNAQILELAVDITKQLLAKGFGIAAPAMKSSPSDDSSGLIAIMAGCLETAFPYATLKTEAMDFYAQKSTAQEHAIAVFHFLTVETTRMQVVSSGDAAENDAKKIVNEAPNAEMLKNTKFTSVDDPALADVAKQIQDTVVEPIIEVMSLVQAISTYEQAMSQQKFNYNSWAEVIKGNR